LAQEEEEWSRVNSHVNDDIVIEIDGDKVLVQPHLEEPLLKLLLQSLKELGVEPSKVEWRPCG